MNNHPGATVDAAVTVIDELDHDLATAAIHLGQARTDWARSPNAHSAATLAIARAALDDLLDTRSQLRTP